MAAHRFNALAKGVSRFTGGATAFALAVGSVVVWAATGPVFHYSSMWQLVINTGTTIVTFLMVFLIQNAQNRDTEAIQIKLDELIRTTHGAQNALLNLEELDPEDLARFRSSYTNLAQRAQDPEDADVGLVGVPAVVLEDLSKAATAPAAAKAKPDRA